MREPTAEAGFELNVNTGRAMRFVLETDASHAPSHWYLIDRAILREHGRALLGPPASELFAPIPRAMLLRALSKSVRWHARDDLERDDDAVLNACRAWRFAEEGSWSSKLAAGRWAQKRVEATEVVAQALQAYSGPGELNPERVEAFLQEVLRRLESAGT